MGMALTSPGVEVTVIDESFYTPAAPGTVPLIVVASGENKVNAAGTGIAPATLKTNVNNAYRVTSQRELVDLFGVPFFEKTASNSPIHGSERNEYGLLAAYSLLGVSNSAFVVRADVDLDALAPLTEAPGADPDDGTWWIDTDATSYGIQEWNSAPVSTTGGQKFSSKTPIILTDDDSTKIEDNDTYGRRPKGSVGSIGDYAVVFETVDGTGTFTASRETARIYYKSPGNTEAGVAAGEWVLIGTSGWRASWPTVSATEVVSSNLSASSFTINGVTVNIPGATSLTELVSIINGLSITGITAKEIQSRLYLYTDGLSSPLNQIVIAGLDTQTAQALGISNGTFYGPELQQTPHTNVPEWKSGDTESRPTGSVWIKTTEPGSGARWRVQKFNANTSAFEQSTAPLYASTHKALYELDRTGGGLNVITDSIFVQVNSDENSGYDDSPETATFRIWRRANTGVTTITSAVVQSGTFPNVDSLSFTIQESTQGSETLASAQTVTFNPAGTAADAFTVAEAINAVGFTNLEAGVTSDNRITISHALGGDFRIQFEDTSSETLFTTYNIDSNTGTNLYELPSGAKDSSGRQIYLASNWQPLAASDFVASNSDPTNEPADGQLWYNPTVDEVDIMIHNGTTWVGYQNYSSAYAETDPNGPQVRSTEPTTQSDGTALVDGDLWISTADLDNYPLIYRWNGTLLSWVQIDSTDQITEEGVIFADARYGLSGATGNTEASIVDLLTTNFIDPDAPDPALYPKGMLLWNTRRSYGNVKRYENNYIDTTADNPRFNNEESMANYATDRWVTASPNNEDGSGNFGRSAQRSVVVAALKSQIDTNSEIRDEERRNFNLIACPGYPEVMQNMVSLNLDRGLTAFVIGDTPLRLPADATSLNNYATNSTGVTDNNDDGIVTFDEYIGVYYPNGFTTDLSGVNAVVPASHMMLRTIALNDNVAFPWFAPAGTRRGGISNATSVGYIDASSGEFQTVALNEGQRDTLYAQKINPIPFFNGVGLVAYGQKTRARNASALDRINVARLIVYLRGQLNRLARPYVFEPNDKFTRDEIKQAVESLLLELVGLRAIFDFVVVCDETNNTPARIDRNELYVDVAIEPTKAVEFIYIPLRVQNTGEL